MTRLKAALARLGRDGWLILLLAVCIGLCLVLGAAGSGGNKADEDARLSQLLSAMDGAGQVRASVFRTSGGEPSAVCILAEGADDVLVQLRLARAARTLLGLSNDQIVILKLKEGTK